jgi:hypothetical protein
MTLEDIFPPNALEEYPNIVASVSDPYINVYSIYGYVEILADRFDIDPHALFQFIYFETGGTFDPHISNKNSSAKGLVQFMDNTSKSIRGID